MIALVLPLRWSLDIELGDGNGEPEHYLQNVVSYPNFSPGLFDHLASWDSVLGPWGLDHWPPSNFVSFWFLFVLG